MAILEKLRVRAGLFLAIIIGLALFAFVLSDFLDSGGTLFSSSKHEIAEIAGRSIPQTDFEEQVKKLEKFQQIRTGQMSFDENIMDRFRNAIWENMVQDIILEKEFKKTGIDVSVDELKELFVGENPHYLVMQYLGDPQTGTLNRQALAQFITSLQEVDESDEKTYYQFVENEVYRSRRFEKYLALLRKSLVATTLQAKRHFNDMNTSVDFEFIVKPFTSISDSAISVNKSELEKYYNTHKNKYKQEESRDIRYLFFEVIPSQEDYKEAEDYIIRSKEEFAKAEDTKQYVNLNSTAPFDDKYYSFGELPDTMNDIMFKAELGTVIGPYFEDNAYKLAKLAEIKYLPDSVRARHILLQATQNNAAQIWKLADSLKEMISKGADFAELAQKYSADKGSVLEGGDLKWFQAGDMVKPFSDSCFFAKKGDIKIVPTQYGLHVVQITDQSKPVKKVQVGILERKVVPSNTTDQIYYSKAYEFAGINNTYEKFNKAVEQQNMTLFVRQAKGVKPLDREIPGLESPRQLIKWAYKADEKEVSSQVFKFGDKYVIGVLDKIHDEGYIPLNEIKEEIEHEVRKEKKAEKIAAEITSKLSPGITIEQLANKLNLQVNTAPGIRLSYPSLPEIGSEPVIVASALQMEKNVVSKPLTGNSGVFVLVVTNVNQPGDAAPEMLDREKMFINRNYAARVNYTAYDALKKMVRIKDNRREFY